MASEGEEEHTARQKSKNVEDVELPTMPQGGSSIASGIQLMVSSNRPKISLHQATRDDREDIVRIWLSHLAKSDLETVDKYGYTAMHYAAKFNRLKIMQLLVSYGANPEVETSKDGLTPLHFSARYIPPYRDQARPRDEPDAGGGTVQKVTHRSSYMAVKFLVENCAVGVNCKDVYGVTPLHLACSRENLQAVEVLLAAPNIVVDVKDNNQDTPLHEACIAGDAAIVEKLLIKMQSEAITLIQKNDEKQLPLHFACSNNHVDAVKLILRYGFPERNELVSAVDNEENTPLHLACNSGNAEIVKVLLLSGADVQAVKNDNITPLLVAARHGFTNIAEVLLEAGQDIIDDVDVHQRSALHVAAENGQSEMIDFLLDNAANVEAPDENSYTPLLTAIANGESHAFQRLLERGAHIDVVDKDSRSSVFLAAKDNHIPILKHLISNAVGAKLCRTADSHFNTPLHIAALNGNVSAVKVLLSTDIKVDAKNEFGKTPMHLTAEQGHTAVAQCLLRYHINTVGDEDEDSNTPLHLACTHGHVGVAKLLINANADVEARNALLWTPMACAAASGKEEVVQLLIEAEAEINSVDEQKVPPLHLACKEGHVKVVKLLLKYDADVTRTNRQGHNALNIAIENDHEDVSMVIIKNPSWKLALRNTSPTVWGGVTTPLRELIKKMPKVAEEVLNQCMVTSGDNVGPRSPGYQVIYNYEFLDDFRDKYTQAQQRLDATHQNYPMRQNKVEETAFVVSESLASDPHDGVFSRGFTNDWGPQGFESDNHPLTLMVNSEQLYLCKHPLVTSLLQYKWRTLGRYSYYANLAIYIVFLTYLMTFALVVPNPQACREAEAESLANNASIDCSNLLSDTRRSFVYAAAVIVIIFAVVRLAMELFQLIQLRVSYVLDWINWLEVAHFIFAIMFVSVFNNECRCPRNWQWQVGILAVFLSWIDLMIFMRQLPGVGIYIVMFINIFKIFLKLIFLCILLLVAFGLALYMAFSEPGVSRTPFASPARSILKTITMTTGEFNFDPIFRQVPGGTEETDADLEEIPFPPISYILWIIFIVLMPILLNNLLVGLAVDDIKGTLEKAVLKRLGLRVELALSIEEKLPPRVRRHFIIGGQVVKNPFKPPSLWKRLFYKVWGQEYKFASKQPQQLDPIKLLQHQAKILAADVDHIKQKLNSDMDYVKHTIARLESYIEKMALKQGIEEDS